MVGEHDALEPGFLADWSEFQQVVGVGEGEGLPELHEASFSRDRAGHVACQIGVGRSIADAIVAGQTAAVRTFGGVEMVYPKPPATGACRDRLSPSRLVLARPGEMKRKLKAEDLRC